MGPVCSLGRSSGIPALGPTSARVQDPLIIPGLPGANLPSGARPALNAWPYTDLPGGEAAVPFDGTEIAPPAAPPYGLWGVGSVVRDFLFDEGIDLRTDFSQSSREPPAAALRETFPYGLKFDYFGTVEGEKLFGWDGLFINLHGESRFGQSINRDVGSLVPANFAPESLSRRGNRPAGHQLAGRAVPGT